MLSRASLKGSYLGPVALNNLSQHLIFDINFMAADRVDRESGITAGFERASTATYVRNDNEFISEVDRPRFEKGLLLEGQGTNKCTCAKYNPQDISGLTQTAGSAILSVVEDSAELAKAGFGIFPGNVYKIDNTSGSIDSSVICSGITNNTNPHSLSVVVRGVGGLTTNSYVSLVPFDNSSYFRVKNENITPTGAGNTLAIITYVGEITYFIIPQIEENIVCTSSIVGDNSASTATRATESADALGNGLSIPLDDIQEVKDCLQGGGTMVLEWTPKVDKGIYLPSGLVSCSDEVESLVFFDGAGNTSSTDGTSTADSPYNYTQGQNIKTAVRWSNEYGLSVSTNNITGAIQPFSGSFVLGNFLRIHFANEIPLEYNRLRFYSRILTDEEITNV